MVLMWTTAGATVTCRVSSRRNCRKEKMLGEDVAPGLDIKSVFLQGTPEPRREFKDAMSVFE
jgi:hypothetical protein